MANFRPILKKDPQGVAIPGYYDEQALVIDDAGGGVTYVGKAKCGTATSVARWQVKRVTIVGADSVVEWADGNNEYDNIWDNRAALAYS